MKKRSAGAVWITLALPNQYLQWENLSFNSNSYRYLKHRWRFTATA